MMVSCTSIVFCASAGHSSCDRNSGEWLQDVWHGPPESGWQKVCKEGRDDIIVKVNLQSPIPTLRLQTNVKTMQG